MQIMEKGQKTEEELEKEKKVKSGCFLIFILAIVIACIVQMCSSDKKKTPEEIAQDNVRSYLWKNLNDPDSYQPIGWSHIIKNGTEYSIIHTYRAKNEFGGMVEKEHFFSLDTINWNVIGVN